MFAFALVIFAIGLPLMLLLAAVAPVMGQRPGLYRLVATLNLITRPGPSPRCPALWLTLSSLVRKFRNVRLTSRITGSTSLTGQPGRADAGRLEPAAAPSRESGVPASRTPA